ncbi:MAG TPA: T9SS type A sorting domain-containing protein [Ignavibacteria bacterium]|nr:T9SS type A sorting domain-containing protein [Ignavibacteria bacterium]
MKSSGIIYPNGTNILAQDLECADGLWHWSNKGQEQRYAWDAGYCYNGSLWDYYLRDSVSYDNDGGWNYSPADGRSHSFPIWAGIGKINETDACKMGTDRIFTNSTEIYANEEVLGDRYDAWKPGYNEVFSPYSSPSSNNWNNSNSGIYIWLYSSSGSGPTTSAAFKIYKAGEGGYTDSSILALTPPSRPMGLKVLPCESQPVINNLKRIKISWNHNMEPDMRRTITGETDKFKRYKIYRTTGEDMYDIPDDVLQNSENLYDYLATVDLNENSAPYFIDSGLVSTCNDALCGATSCWEMYPVRYRVQAVDIYNDVSVLSDFVNTEAWNIGEGEGGYYGDNISVNEIETNEGIPTEYSLYQNYPNPFNPVTKIKYGIPFDGNVTIKIFDISGRLINTLVNEYKAAGRFETDFHGENLSSGVYYYRIESGEFSQVKKMILIK